MSKAITRSGFSRMISLIVSAEDSISAWSGARVIFISVEGMNRMAALRFLSVFSGGSLHAARQ